MATLPPSHLAGVIRFPGSAVSAHTDTRTVGSPIARHGTTPPDGSYSSWLRERASNRLGALALDTAFHMWRGESGKVYVHTVYELLTCPSMPAATYVLVRRDDEGEQTVLKVGRVENDAPSKNLAEIRQRAARLGANEVHLHLLADTRNERGAAVVDLAAALVDDLPSSQRPVRRSTHTASH